MSSRAAAVVLAGEPSTVGSSAELQKHVFPDHEALRSFSEPILDAGDGFSPRAEDAVLHGCIPVVIVDNVDPVFATVLDWDSFSLRIAEVQPWCCSFVGLCEGMADRLAGR